MTRKVIKVGSSAAVTIPKALLKKLGLSIGDSVELEGDTKGVMVRPAHEELQNIDPNLITWAKSFNTRYSAALKELAKK